VGSFGETKNKAPADFGLLSWAIFADATRNLLLYHFDLAGVRVVVEFRSVRRRRQFAHIIRHQFIQVLGQTSFLSVEQLDFLVEIRYVNRLDGVLVRPHQRAQIIRRIRSGIGSLSCVGGLTCVGALGMRTGIVFAATGQKQSDRNRNQEGRVHIGNLAQTAKNPKVNYSFETVQNQRPHSMGNALRDFPPIPAAQPYCGGALVDGASGAGAAGALVARASDADTAGTLVADIVVGGVPVSACFLQPVNSPTHTNPDTATNNNIFFILG